MSRGGELGGRFLFSWRITLKLKDKKVGEPFFGELSDVTARKVLHWLPRPNLKQDRIATRRLSR
jgi:hypothetical protein